jgi:glycosyltransferase involved in cell wall biosynthesis
MGVPKEKLHKLLFGVDTEMFHPEIEIALMRERLNLAPGPIVYSPRAFKPIYNQITIVEAVPMVLKVYPDCRFIFKHRSDHHSPEYEIKVRQRIEELGIVHAVRIVEPIPYEQLPALYALSDVIVSVPESDGTPRSVLEAMACGAFPVVSDVPALHEWIIHEDNGFFVSSVEAPKIAEAILQALSSRQFLDKAKLKNRRIVESRASKDVWVNQLEALYGMLCDRGR